jgi:heme A synthase
MNASKPNDGRRRLVWVLAMLFILLGVYMAGTQRFERWAGQQLEKAAPTARRVVPLPAKRILRESREHLPVYGHASQWVSRKGASVVYFGLVGLFVLWLRKRRPESLKETLLVTVAGGVGMSLIVEIVEAPGGEPFNSQLFDLGCGALGGIVAGVVWWMFRKGRR